MTHSIADLRAEYDKADQLCQEVNNFLNKAAIPAINELRYAGHHLLQGIGDAGRVADPDHIDQAVNHARRASYEATEAGIVFAVEAVKKFQDDYRTIVVADLLPDYAARIQSCEEGLRLIEQGRQTGFNRDVDHQNRIDAFRKLRTLAGDMNAVRGEANKKVSQKQRNARVTLFGTLLALLAAIFGFPQFLQSIRKPPQEQTQKPPASVAGHNAEDHRANAGNVTDPKR